MLLDDATFQRFGYHLADKSARSHKKVICFCPACERIYETQRRYHQDVYRQAEYRAGTETPTVPARRSKNNTTRDRGKRA